MEEHVLVPAFEVASCPSIKIDDVRARRFYIVDQAQQRAQASMMVEEDANILGTMIGGPYWDCPDIDSRWDII